MSKKRALESPEESYFDENGCQDSENDEADEVDALNALGYMPHTHHVLLGKTNKGTVDADNEPVQSKELQTAIMSMPAKPYMGMPLTLRFFPLRARLFLTFSRLFGGQLAQRCKPSLLRFVSTSV